MADNFLGYLIRNSYGTLSRDLLAENGYKSNPNIQTDKNSYTDGTGLTHRTILSHLRSKIWLTFKDEISTTEKQHVQTIFPSRTLVKLTYWNDEEEKYKSGDFYIPDIDWTIKRIDKATNTRYYSSLAITLIEY